MRMWRFACFLILLTTASAQVSFGPFEVSGKLPKAAPKETSGLVVSRQNVLWVHGDGKQSSLVALRPDGTTVQQYRFAKVAGSDWEDIAIGPGPKKGRDYLYIANTGNNDLRDTVVSILRLEEPIVPKKPGPPIELTVESFAFRYPKRTHDAEVLVIDPTDGCPYVFSKPTHPSEFTRLYRYPLPLQSEHIKTLEFVCALGHEDLRFSAGDISRDGRFLALRNNKRVYIFPRKPKTTLAAALEVKPTVLYADGQGNAEALAFDPLGKRLFTTSEGRGAAIRVSARRE